MKPLTLSAHCIYFILWHVPRAYTKIISVGKRWAKEIYSWNPCNAAWDVCLNRPIVKNGLVYYKYPGVVKPVLSNKSAFGLLMGSLDNASTDLSEFTSRGDL